MPFLSSNRTRARRIRTGFVLPFTIIISLVIFTGVAFWYQQSLVSSVLAARVLERRANFAECGSLVPYVTSQLNEKTADLLSVAREGFLTIQVDHDLRWEIDRTALKNGKIKLTFRKMDGSGEKIDFFVRFNPV